jgi:hypothetical protein
MKREYAIVGLLLSLLAYVVASSTLDNTFLRESSWLTYSYAVCGIGFSLAGAIGSGRWLPRLLAIPSIAAALLLLVSFLVLARIPAHSAVAVGSTVPDFQLGAHSLQAELAKGPVLLVFYRGHW